MTTNSSIKNILSRRYCFSIKDNKAAQEFKNSTLTTQDAGYILKKVNAIKNCIKERNTDV